MVESTRVRSKRLSFSGKKTLSSFMQVNIASLRQSGKLRTSETYKSYTEQFYEIYGWQGCSVEQYGCRVDDGV